MGHLSEANQKPYQLSQRVRSHSFNFIYTLQQTAGETKNEGFQFEAHIGQLLKCVLCDFARLIYLHTQQQHIC
jgi:hypothetical protein